MSRRFRVLSICWMVAVMAATPLLLEWFDRRGMGFAFPGLPVTVSEIIVGSAVALLPPGLIWLLHSRRSHA